MSREIKFRAWHKEFELFSEIALNYSINDIQHLTDYEWSQYTGLKDKNGKEIYEGDIVKVNLLFTTLICEVQFNDGCFEVVIKEQLAKDYLTRDYLKCHTCNHAVEVIGNIHENNNLLEVSHE